MDAPVTVLCGCIGPAFKDRSCRVYQVSVNGATGSDTLRRNIRLIFNPMGLQKVYAKGAKLGLRNKVLKMAEKWGTMRV